jgi:hypothetical protein
MKKTIATENGAITIRGNCRWVPIEYKQAEWSDGAEAEVPCFKYQGDYVFLDEAIVTDPRGIFSEYDGIVGFGYGSGLLIKLNASRDAVQVFYFYAHSQLDD